MSGFSYFTATRKTSLHTGIPTIGVAKTRLIGRHELVDAEKESRQPLWDKGEIVGMVLQAYSGRKR